jgi:cobalt-zinc-cadmium efflux system outer membrane protein
MFAKPAPALSLILLVFLTAAARARQEPQPPGTGAAGAAVAAAGDPFAGAARLDRRALLAEVARRNPTLEAARLAWQAAAARPPQERALPDPMLSYEVAPGSIAGSSLRFGQAIELSQDLPLPGRRRLRGERAAAEARGVAADYRSVLLDLLTTASQLYDDDCLVSRSLAIVAQHRALLAELQAAAAGRYAAGLVPQQDPIQAELEGSKMLHRQVELEAEREAIASRLAALLHLPADHALPPPSVEPEPPEAGQPDPGALVAAALVASALAARPELAARTAAVEAQRAALDLARLAGRPDLALRGSYDSMWNEPGYRWMAGVAVNLPVRRDRLASQRVEAEARLAQAQAELAATEDRIRAEVRNAAIEVREAHHLLAIFADRLLPAARDQVHAARSGFETGRGSFLGVIDAERSLRDVELGREQAVTSLHRKMAALDRAMGRLPAGLPADLLEPGAERPALASPPLPHQGDEGVSQ